MMVRNPNNLESGASLVRLALANYRARRVNLPESEHADDAQLLLRLANEDQALVDWASALTGADSSELQKSAIYFIEHQCFSSAADFYGILALNPWATLDDLKTHYRLLIRIFHPDRGLVSEQLAEKYSAMINQAYAALKNTMPVQAKITDANANANANAKLRRGISKFVRDELKAENAKRKGLGFKGLRFIHLNQVRWFTPGKILFGFAAIAASSIYYFVMPETVATSTFHAMRSGKHGGLGYYDDAPMDARSAGSGNVHSEIENTAIKLSQLESRNVDKVFTESSRSMPVSEPEVQIQQAATPKPKTQETQYPVPKPQVLKPQELKLQEPTKAPLALPNVNLNAALNVKPNDSRRTSAAAVNTDESAQKPLSATFKPLQEAALPILAKPTIPKIDHSIANAANSAQPGDAALPVVVPAKPLVAAPVAHQKLDETPATDVVANTDELRKLLFMFVDGYQRGDIKTFMQVFSEDVQSDDGGYNALQQAYIDVFSTTTDREMVVKNMHWTQQGQQMTGNASYEVKIRRNEHTKLKTVTGKLRLNVVKVNHLSKISGFYYVSDR
jgi:hypothetical protein